MNTLRAILGILGGLSAGYALAALWLLTPTDFGVGLAISAACVIGIGLVRAIQRDRQRAADKARHPSSGVASAYIHVGIDMDSLCRDGVIRPVRTLRIVEGDKGPQL